jgi:hypothetical protein
VLFSNGIVFPFNVRGFEKAQRLRIRASRAQNDRKGLADTSFSPRSHGLPLRAIRLRQFCHRTAADLLGLPKAWPMGNISEPEGPQKDDAFCNRPDAFD